MTGHPTNRAERIKLKKANKRRDDLLKEAIRKQELEDAKAKERDLAQFGSASGGDISPQFEIHQ